MGSQGYAKKHPCSICRRWFMPHPRLKERQKTCGDTVCKKEWHRRKCTEWNQANSDYFKANYLQKKLDSQATTSPVKSRLKTGLPLERVQEVIGMQHLIIIEYLAQLLVKRFQDVIWRQVPVNTGQVSRLPREVFLRCDRQ
jgi:hypothetical protein